MKTLIAGIIAMAAIVVASNILVQHTFGSYLTYGAFTYPLSFLVNDIINRLAGVKAARRVVLAGFVVGLVCSFIGTQLHNDYGPLVTLRVALGSGTAFLVGQLLDVTIFDRLRRAEWWRAPLVSTLIGSTIDSVIFFTIAFAASLTFLEPSSDMSWAAVSGPLLGSGPMVPLWVSLALADWGVKFGIAVFGLLPFRLIIAKFSIRVA
ncbi:MAG: hypothetical protein RLZZ607_1291 [Pseudomonadota bacterium]|jgi:uncharacterized integral membrane protein (TIGR00697 family)